MTQVENVSHAAQVGLHVYCSVFSVCMAELLFLSFDVDGECISTYLKLRTLHTYVKTSVIFLFIFTYMYRSCSEILKGTGT